MANKRIGRPLPLPPGNVVVSEQGRTCRGRLAAKGRCSMPSTCLESVTAPVASTSTRGDPLPGSDWKSAG